jgi:hypothetical protein
LDGLYRVKRKIRPWGLASDSHGMKREDDAVYRPIGKSQGTREEGRVRRERGKQKKQPF